MWLDKMKGTIEVKITQEWITIQTEQIQKNYWDSDNQANKDSTQIVRERWKARV